MVRTAALICFALAGCDSIPHSWTRGEIEDIAADAAADAIDDTPGVSAPELAVTVARLEAQVAKLEKEQAEDDDSGLWTDEAFDRLYRNDETLRQNVNWLLAQQGVKPIPRVD